ncbi:MAG TPA: pyridoxal-phosphate dependent enzyme [Stellaceae bacterium]|nr:pyridoxal-phosphate dependent enzyme [Stellaceae bacterium]
MTTPTHLDPAYLCPTCGRSRAADRPLWRCDCGGPVDLEPGPGLRRGDIATGEASLWRYASALALRAPPSVSLGEGWTPLVRRDWAGVPAWFKLESQMPTGSFKDRGSAAMINHLIEVGHLTETGIGPIHEDSSGNAGSSIASYAAAAGIPCRIYVPADAPRAKLVQIAAAGAELCRVPGSRQAVAEAALAATGSFYASHNWHPYFIEGTKTLAFELWEQLGFRLPDNILVPTGYGSNILGLERGFDALEKAGEIKARPRLFAVQAANCAALAAAWEAGAQELVPFATAPTIADGIATLRPVRGGAVLRALRRSRGAVVAVAEAEIGPALLALGRLGLFVEPTAATAAAALTRLVDDGTIAGTETTIVVLTGSGLKAAERIGELLEF